ncbi:UDP-glucose-4-epimerase [Planoprotostelium fungivorum]|uniref:UDP-glucose 4-epimerase n=1 Tax=Planoprotostelium fungivorum TaxID=1890364 RepID=A0A2P6NYP8_9EUKA|nr:UDP-glucose-4-epimerase [Planoprotostelium fungivorum]
MGHIAFVTGGTGYIGSHVLIILLEAGYDVICLHYSDIHVASQCFNRVEEITGKKIKRYKGNLVNEASVRMVFEENKIHTVFHLAALKAVSESVQKPLEYYNNNVTGTLNLLKIMNEYKVNHLVFSSSATVYGSVENCAQTGIIEEQPTNPINPYGQTKAMVEQILRDLHISKPDMNIAVLRYFNPVGAHPSGKIGEDPKGIPNNLVPFILQVATGLRQRLYIYGDDYETRDGTGMRDYVHVMDLARGHLLADRFLEERKGVYEIFNLGSGKGTTVFEIMRAIEDASGKKIPYEVAPRRSGDVGLYIADSSKAHRLLSWTPQLSLTDIDTLEDRDTVL